MGKKNVTNNAVSSAPALQQTACFYPRKATHCRGNTGLIRVFPAATKCMKIKSEQQQRSRVDRQELNAET